MQVAMSDAHHIHECTHCGVYDDCRDATCELTGKTMHSNISRHEEKIGEPRPCKRCPVMRVRLESSQWQPMETAPKDGRAFLAFFPMMRRDNVGYARRDVRVIRWPTEYGIRRQPGGVGPWMCMITNQTIETLNPSHWMPLPEEPPE